MRYLFNSRVEVTRLAGGIVNGAPKMRWEKITTVPDPILGVPGELLCRLDLTFQRPGKDAPMPIVAGRSPDRVGLMFFSVTDALKAGDRVRTLSGPVTGTFEIRAIPDPAVGFSASHHMEVQIVEVAQAVANAYPGASPEVNP